jgi:rare lipoprotein A
MRSTFSLGALALLLSGSALVPAMADSSKAATGHESVALAAPAPEVQEPSTKVAIREADAQPTTEDSLIKQAPPAPIAPLPKPAPRVVLTAKGQASWYGPGFYGNRTASGEVFRPGTQTAAHRTLPFGTKVRVTNLWNGRSTVVRINDRGPFHGNRVIDLAHGAAQTLGLTASGVAQVRLDVLR